MKKLFIKPIITLFVACTIMITPSIAFYNSSAQTIQNTHYIDRQY